VDAQCQRRRVHRRDRDPTVEQQPEHRGRQATVIGGDDIGAGAVTVVIEADDLDVFTLGDAGQRAQAARVRVLHEHQPAHRIGVDRRRLHRGDLVRVQVEELPHVAVRTTVQADPRARIQQLRRQHRREGVEVDVGVRQDQCLDGDLGGHRIGSAAFQARFYDQPPGTTVR
jgi:hypothetical protein